MNTGLVAQFFAQWSALVLTCILLLISIPLVVVAFYYLRLLVRRQTLRNKLLELNLESEYVRLYDSDRWQELRKQTDATMARQKFIDALNSQFRGDNRGLSYLPPTFLLALTSLAFVGIVARVWQLKKDDPDLLSYPVLFAIAGAFVYVYPRVISRYASLTLNPQAVYELLGALWISVITGVAFMTLADDHLKLAAALLGSLLPVPALQFIRDKFLTTRSDSESAQAAEQARLMEVIGQDADLVEQLSYIGVRSVRALADENPIRLFAEVDPDLMLCVNIVDRANFYQWFPDADIRLAVQNLGYRAAVDVMTLIYEERPPKANPGGAAAFRFIELDEPLPDHLTKPLEALASAAKFPDVQSLRNLLAMMAEDPQLAYLQQLWIRIYDAVAAAFSVQGRVATSDVSEDAAARRDQDCRPAEHEARDDDQLPPKQAA